MNKDEVVSEIRKRFSEAYDAEEDNYTKAIEDLEFLDGNQWPDDIKKQREVDGRPCLVLNKIATYADQIIGDVRMNAPSIKVKGVDSGADPKTAEIMTGLIRNIEVQSNADIAYDTAGESCVNCGIGAFRIVTEYSDDETFNQDIKIKRIKNPFTIYWDPAATEWDKSDARYCFVTEKISLDEFKRQYPDAGLLSFPDSRDRDPNWGDDKNIRIVEYFRKIPIERKLYLIQNEDGQKTVATSRPNDHSWKVMQERETEGYKIEWYKANQSEILEGPTEIPGRYIPVVMVYGKELNIEGRTVYRGIIRNAKDSQRLYNYSRSTGAEIVSLAPKAPWVVTKNMISNYQVIWDNAHKRSYPYLPYDADTANPQLMPKRSDPIVMNTGIQAEIAAADQELRDTTGLQQANLGMKSNEKSGRAILARQKEGDVANFPFYDNLARAIRHAGRILVDLIPKIYDTPRVVRILGEGDQEDMVPINQPFPQQLPNGNVIQAIFDLTMGKYDVVVTVGPSYTTQREEASAAMMDFMQAAPQMAPLMADILAKNLDWPGAKEIETRMKAMLPPQLQAAIGGGNGPPQPQQPDPAMLLEMRDRASKVQNQDILNEQEFHKLRRLKEGKPMEPKEPKEKKDAD